MLRSFYLNFRNLILYALIGGFCASLDFCIYSLLCYCSAVPYLWANIISTNAGILTSFALNRSINFKVKDKTSVRFFSFYLIGLIGLGISSLMLYTLVDIAGRDEFVCKLLSIVIVALVQFLLHKFITFRTGQK